MSLAPGTRIGPYAIVAPIGAGGMGEVYRARDLTLEREVAIKVLPESFARDAERVARFTREAKTLAALNHPNIAALYGIEVIAEPTPGVVSHALVMELVEGDDLSRLLAAKRGPGVPRGLEIDDAVAIARQLADALEAAHEQGIVHRDLKPANIKVRPDGTVKVLDFGLARAVQGGASRLGSQEGGPRSDQGQSQSAMTMTSPAVTGMGTILGTAAYMSPEQAKGRPVDRRADIWAFGVVLYEMLTGRRAFAGDDVSDLLVAVLRDTPDFSALPSDVPAPVRRLLRRCLEKDPRNRLSAVGDARLELDERERVEASVPPVPAASRRMLVAAAAGAVLLAGAAATAVWFLKPDPSPPVRLLDLPADIASSSRVALSPDGSRVAYISDNRLYVRALDSLAARDLGPVNAAEGSPFPDVVCWSPDSTMLAFSAERQIRTIPASGGPVFAVGPIPATGVAIAATWFEDGTIVFAVWRENVYSLPAAGGTPTVALALDPAKEIDVHHISEAPGGRLIAYIHRRSGDRGESVLATKSGGPQASRVVLTDDQTIEYVNYVAPGFFVFNRQQTNVGLWVAPFTGGPLDLTKATLLQAGAAGAQMGADGSAVFGLPAVSRASPAWVDRSGAVSVAAGSPVGEVGAGFSLSPDGRKVALITGGWQPGVGSESMSLILRDLASGTDTRLAPSAVGGQGPSSTILSSPTWFPSGDRILLSTGGVESGRLVAQRADEPASPTGVASDLMSGQIARDGRTLVGLQDDHGHYRLLRAPLSAAGVAGPLQRVFADVDPSVDDFDISPDGLLVAYTVRQDSGLHVIMLSEVQTGRGQWQVADNGEWPRFAPDGREIFYVAAGAGSAGPGGRTLVSRALQTKPAVSLGPAITLFGGDSASLMANEGFDVAPDGRRFLVLKDVAPAPGEGPRLLWLQNWQAALHRPAR